MVSVLLGVGVVAVVIWLLLRARNKLRQASEQARARELAFMEGLGRQQERVPPAAPAALAPAPLALSPASASAAAAAPSGAYLSEPSARAFRLLKSALPGHEIFPRGSLRRVLGPLAPGKDLEVDFVLCSADLRPVAVVDLVAPDDLAPVIVLKAERLAAAGVAYARWNADALPSADEVVQVLRKP